MTPLNMVGIPTPCWFVAFLPSGPGAAGRYAEIDVADYWWFQDSFGSGGGANYFPLGSFSAVGEYDVVDSNIHYTAHLSVRQVPAPPFPGGPLTLNPLTAFRTFTAKLDVSSSGFQG